jgi:hypothetical protein
MCELCTEEHEEDTAGTTVAPFKTSEQKRDWLILQKAIEEAPTQIPCTNFPDAWFPENADTTLMAASHQARELCRECPVIRECGTYGLKHENWGTWGGMTQLQIRQTKGRRIT